MNLGVGGDDVIGDLIELVEIGDGLPTGVLRKTRAGGNWLMGGIVIMRVSCSMVLICSYCSVVWMSSFGVMKCTFCGESGMVG